MKVENGTKPENGTVCKNGLQTEVIMVCDRSSQWNSQDISEFVSIVYHHGDDPCMVGGAKNSLSGVHLGNFPWYHFMGQNSTPKHRS